MYITMSLEHLTENSEKKWMNLGPETLIVYGTSSFAGSTANAAVYLNNNKVLSSVALSNGQLLIGASGTSPIASTITGTTNQVNVANGAGSITLSTPQNIGTGSSPSFSSLSLSSQSIIIAKNTSAQSISTGVATAATFTSVSTRGTDITYSAGTFTANVTGVYTVNASADFGAGTAGAIALSTNATSAGPCNGQNGYSQQANAAGTTQYLVSPSTLELTAGDTFIIALFQNSGGSINCNGAGVVSVYRVS
jgi:hypothetical protein